MGGGGRRKRRGGERKRGREGEVMIREGAQNHLHLTFNGQGKYMSVCMFIQSTYQSLLLLQKSLFSTSVWVQWIRLQWKA